MGLLDFLKKEEIPDELPDLASDEIEDDLKNDSSEEKENLDKKEDSDDEKPEESKDEEDSEKKEDLSEEKEKGEDKEDVKEVKFSDLEGDLEEDSSHVDEIKKALSEDSKKDSGSDSGGFFEELNRDISEGISDLGNLEELYNKKISSKDMISEMRDHWESQKKDRLLESFSKSFKERLSERTGKLQKLEKDWQNTYFDLIEKEEEIRGEEAELKALLAEFLEACKKRKDRLKDNEQENKDERTENKQTS